DMTLSMDDLEPLVGPRGSFVLECSGNRGSGFGLMSAASWDGVLIEELLKMVSPKPHATRLLVSGFDESGVPSRHSTRGASWIFSFDQLVEAGAFLATRMNGEALPPDHGAPVRLFAPGWYGCTAIKWADELRLVGEDEPATAQMREFASRTHQRGVPDLARDYRAAVADQAAMPVRIEQWRVGGATRYRVVGIVWGGQKVFDRPTLRFNPGEPFVPVHVCPAMKHNQPWTLWSHVWHPPGPGRYRMRARIDDWGIPTRRLDQGWYDRVVEIS
ncbi:MAG: molybdopterin-dependent oxidoreductase, partial [Gammaproteobacteria bacterium]